MIHMALVGGARAGAAGGGRQAAGAHANLKLSVGVTCHPYLLETEGLFTQGWRPGRTFGESVGAISEMDSSDWSSGIRYHTFVTRPDTEFKSSCPRNHWLQSTSDAAQFKLPLLQPSLVDYEQSVRMS